jgi:hypothetical protein
MGLLSFLKPKKESESLTGFKNHLIDTIITISIPADWIPFKSDRFRTATQDGKTKMSVTNYEKQNSAQMDVNEQFLKDLKLPLYEKFKTEGGYEPYNDLESTDSYIMQSFKVDEETQYYLSTANSIKGSVVCTDIIIREIAEYDLKTRLLLLNIFKSIKPK